MLQIRLENTQHGSMNVFGIPREDLERILEGDVCITDIGEPAPAGVTLLLAADTHEEMVAAIQETDLFDITHVIDRRTSGPPPDLPNIKGYRLL